MTVEEYFEKWWTSKKLPEQGFNKTAMLDFAEMYHNQALRIHDAIGSVSMQDLMLYYQDAENFDFTSKAIEVLNSMVNDR